MIKHTHLEKIINNELHELIEVDSHEELYQFPHVHETPVYNKYWVPLQTQFDFKI